MGGGCGLSTRIDRSPGIIPTNWPIPQPPNILLIDCESPRSPLSKGYYSQSRGSVQTQPLAHTQIGLHGMRTLWATDIEEQMKEENEKIG